MTTEVRKYTPQIDSHRTTRRGLFIVGTAALSTSLLACGQSKTSFSPEVVRLPQPYQTPNPEKPYQPVNLEERTRKSVEELARRNLGKETGLPDQVARLYLKMTPLSNLSPTFGELTVGFDPTTDEGYSRFGFLYGHQLSPDKKFQLTANGEVKSYEVHLKLDPQIRFSQEWLTGTSPDVQWLVMMKEATNLLLWPGVVRKGRQIVQNLGIRVEKLDPRVSDMAVDEAVWILLSSGIPSYKLAFDYGGLLAIWPWVTRVMEGSADIRRGIERTEIDGIYFAASREKLTFNYPFNSQELTDEMFNFSGRWNRLLQKLYPGLYS